MPSRQGFEKWLEDLYSGKGREFRPAPPPEDTSELPFFDPRFHEFAARWYRARFQAGDPKRALPDSHKSNRVRL